MPADRPRFPDFYHTKIPGSFGSWIIYFNFSEGTSAREEAIKACDSCPLKANNLCGGVNDRGEATMRVDSELTSVCGVPELIRIK